MGAADTTIAAELAANRARLFVGRASELAAFRRLFLPDSPARVLFIHGPGGIGKTTLLHAFEARARETGIAVMRCDARMAPADPRIVGAILRTTIERAPSPYAAKLLIVDTFEEWAAIERWFRDEFLADLSTNIRVVVAGRRAPGLRWRSDPGWHDVLDHHEMAPLSSDECFEYLERRAISPTSSKQAIRVSRGHPLLLALIADAHRAKGDAGDLQEDVPVEELLASLAEHLVPRSEHLDERGALYLSCLLRHSTERLLEEVLHVGPARAAELFDWLADLSFMEITPAGIFPHDVMRVAMRAHLERNHPLLRRELLDAAVPRYLDRLEGQPVPDPELLIDNLYLFTSFMPQIFVEAVLADEPCYAEPAQAEDLPRLRELVGRIEGDESLALFDSWWREQPEATRVVRNSEGEFRGFFTILELRDPTAEWLEDDPLLAAFWDQRDRLDRPWKPETDVILFLRRWLHVEAHMGPSPVSALWSLEVARARLTNEDVVMIGAIHPSTRDWMSNSAMYGHALLEGSEHTLGDHHVVVTLHDFSEESTPQWFRHTYTRFRESQPTVPLLRNIEPASLRAVLRKLHRPSRLVDDPLVARVSSADPVTTLRAAIEAECEILRGNPATEELYRVLDRTYLRPAADQRAAAEACQLTWDQYRRRLTEAIKVLAARLPASIR